MPRPARYTETRSIALDPDTAEEIEQIAAAEGSTSAQVMRRLILVGLASTQAA